MSEEVQTLGPASAKQEMILNSDAQICIIGGAAGSGKSYLLQMLPLRYIDDSKTTIIMFRRTTPQIKGQGGIFDTAFNMYNELDDSIRPTFRSNDLTCRFPSGASMKWQHKINVPSHSNMCRKLI